MFCFIQHYYMLETLTFFFFKPLLMFTGKSLS